MRTFKIFLAIIFLYNFILCQSNNNGRPVKPIYQIEIKDGKITQINELNKTTTGEVGKNNRFDKSRERLQDNGQPVKLHYDVFSALRNIDFDTSNSYKNKNYQLKFVPSNNIDGSLKNPELLKNDLDFREGKTSFNNVPENNRSPLLTYDLYVANVTLKSASGSTITYQYTIGNNGTGAVSSGFENDVYLSTNTTISTSDYLIAKWTAGASVPAGGSYTSNVLSTTVSGVPNGTYYLGVITDATNIVAETNENNNTGYDPTTTLTIGSVTYDLYVANVTVTGASGSTVNYQYTIGNYGTGVVSSGFENDVYLSTNTTISTSDYLIATWIAGSSVPAGGSYTSNVLSTAVSGVPNGTYYLGVITDATNIVAETNENNNTGYDGTTTVIVGGYTYDLYVANVTVTGASGSTVNYQYTIGNYGTGVVGSGFENDVYLSTNTIISTSDYLIATWTAGSNVPAGGSYTSNVLSTTVSGVPNGTYYLGVITDATNMVAETNENNNTGYDGTTIVNIGGYTYDLYVANVTVTGVSGSTVSYQYTIGNYGTGVVGYGFENDVYLSTNTTISTTDYLIAEWTAGSNVPAGGSYTSNVLSTTVSGIPNGTYYLGVITDATNMVAETNENNNTGYDPTTTLSYSGGGGTYDLYVANVTVVGVSGATVSYQYTIGNNGTGVVGYGFENDVYLSLNTIINTSDYLIAKWTAGSNVPAGGSYTSNVLSTTVSGVPNGTYYLGVITDATNMVDETNENNNTGYAGSPNIVTSVEQSTILPRVNALSQNYPNPFNPSTVISFDIAKSSYVTLTIYNSAGQAVLTLVKEHLQPGSYQKELNASSLSSGFYFYRLQTDEFVQTKKMLLLK